MSCTVPPPPLLTRMVKGQPFIRKLGSGVSKSASRVATVKTRLVPSGSFSVAEKLQADEVVRQI